MSNGAKTLLTAALCTAIVSCAIGAVNRPDKVTPDSPASPTPAVSVRPSLAEDDPGWDCRTMGNRTCGPSPRN